MDDGRRIFYHLKSPMMRAKFRLNVVHARPLRFFRRDPQSGRGGVLDPGRFRVAGFTKTHLRLGTRTAGGRGGERDGGTSGEAVRKWGRYVSGRWVMAVERKDGVSGVRAEPGIGRL